MTYKRTRRWLVNLAVAGGSLLLALLLLEIGLRLVNPYGAAIWTRPDDVLGWSHIPNAPYKSSTEGCPGWGSEGRMNSHGLRDDEYDYAKPANTFRVLALGDSYTEGLQHPLEYIWPKLLEQQLNARRDGTHYEVINAGHVGMGTTHEYLYYTTEGYRYSPDLVIVLVIGNDLEDNSKALSPSYVYSPYYSLVSDQLVLDNSFNTSPDYRRRVMINSIKQKSFLVSYLHHLYSQIQAPLAPAAAAPADNAEPAYTSELKEAIAVTQRVFVELNRATQASGARLVIFNGSRAYWDKAQPDALLTEVARANDVPYFDLMPRLQDYAARTGEYVFGCAENGGFGHWSRAAHAQGAALMYEFLRQSRLLP